MDEFSYKLAYEALRKRLDKSPMPFLLGERVYFTDDNITNTGIILSGVMTDACGNCYNIKTDSGKYISKRVSELFASKEELQRGH